jgi:serine/threonine-protein kinase
VAVDGRADLYALGVTAFYALTGRLPFEATASAKLLAAHLLEPAPPLASVSSTIDARIGEVVDRCLLKDPGARWQTGEELASALAAQNQKSRPMPPSVRHFVTTLSGAMGQLAFLWLALTWSYILAPDQYPLIAKVLALLAIAPIIPILDASRAVAIAGYTVDDVVEAVRADKAGSDAYTQYVKRSVEQTNKTMKGPLARVMFGLGGGFLILLGIVLVDVRSVAPLGKAIARVVFGLLTGWMGVEFVAHGLQLGVFKTRLARFMERQATRDMTTRLWGSWPVRALLAVGRKLLWTIPGIKAPSRATVAENRPTEVMLAAAADEIFIGLNDADRAIVADVPRVIRQMQGAAADFRRKQDALDKAIGSVGDVAGNAKRAEVLAEMQAERANVAERLRSTVEAMENLRLDLLKLRAGVGNAGALTDAIAAGKRVSEGIDYTIAGREEASRVVR